GILEPLAVAFEELVRAALALDADEQRLLIVDPLAQLLGAFRKKAAGRALEKQERRPRFELRIAGGELAIALLQRAEVLAFFSGQLLKDLAPARVFGLAGRARVELEAAALGRDRHPQRIAREHQ